MVRDGSELGQTLQAEYKRATPYLSCNRKHRLHPPALIISIAPFCRVTIENASCTWSCFATTATESMIWALRPRSYEQMVTNLEMHNHAEPGIVF